MFEWYFPLSQQRKFTPPPKKKKYIKKARHIRGSRDTRLVWRYQGPADVTQDTTRGSGGGVVAQVLLEEVTGQGSRHAALGWTCCQ